MAQAHGIKANISSLFDRIREWSRAFFQDETPEDAVKMLQALGVPLDPNRDPRDQLDEVWFWAIK